MRGPTSAQTTSRARPRPARHTLLPPLLLALLLVPAAAAQLPTPPALVPEQERVTLGEDGLIVHWAVVGRPYGEGDLPHVVWSSGERQGVQLADLVGVVAPGASPTTGGAVPLHTYVYAARIDVAPGETLTYRAGAGSGYTPERTVSRPPSHSLHFAALGDIGVDATAPDGGCTAAATDAAAYQAGCPAHAIRDRVLAAKPDLLVIPGDLAYANSRQGWDSFMRMYAPLQGTVPTMAVAGNHEYHVSLGYAQFLAQYVLPGDEHHYTFRAGPVTFVAVNSDNICGPHRPPTGPPQDVCAGGHLSWAATEGVRQALEAAQQDDAPWTVLYMHHPPYAYGRHGDHRGLQWLYQDWIETYGVDVVLTAHDHLYSRSHPMLGGVAARNGTEYTQGDGPVYLVTGGGGRGLYEARGDRPAWLAVGESVHHFTEFHATNETLRITATRIDGSELDSFTILRALASEDDPRKASPAPLAGAILLLGALWARRRG